MSYTASADSTQTALLSGAVDGRIYHSLYGEFGLGNRITLGFDYGQDGISSQGNVFGRYTLSRNAATWQFAVDGGLGFRDDRLQTTELLRLGASFGRGFSRDALAWVPYVAAEGGWFSVDSMVLLDPDGDGTIWQSEATLGVNFNEQFGAMTQLKVEEYPDADLAVTMRPSFIWHVSEGTTAQLGASFGLEGTDQVGVRLGLWQTF